MREVPGIRRRARNDAPERPRGDYVLYWMTAARRPRWNFALEHAAARARALGKPLLVLEALRLDYPFASDRLHRFVLDGMAANAAAFERAGVRYLPYVEPARGAGRGLLEALARRAALVVTDDWPGLFLPRMVETAAERLAVRLEQVDSNGLLPLRAAPGAFATAYAFRRFLQRTLRSHLEAFPRADPLARWNLPRAAIPREVLARWPAAGPALLRGEAGGLGALAVDHGVPPTGQKGGFRAAGTALRRFLEEGLARYAEDRNHPDLRGTSGLSAWLHFGHLSAHEVVDGVLRREGWSIDGLAPASRGSREGWWGVSGSAEAFLDQLVTWRELGHVAAAQGEDVASYRAVPDWARRTLAEHARDPRPYRYSLPALAAGDTHDDLWNAAQGELRQNGSIHSYLRMLWGKKVLEWSPSPEEAMARMVELNDRYALDGRDPNSYSGIAWCLGRYDRPWAPERPIFGRVRYMSSENTVRKIRLRRYREEFGRLRCERRGGDA